MADNFWKNRNGILLGSLSAAPANPKNGDMYYDTTLGSFQRYQNGAWGAFGSGGGGSGKNYLSAVRTSQSSTPNTGNGDFELGSTTGWSLAHSSLTSSFPSTVGTAGNSFSSAGGAHGGSAASGNLSLSAVSSSQLAGGYSASYASSAATTAGDMVISDAFNIDTEDQAKVLRFSFAYKANSGGSNGNFSGTSSNSFGVAIYDVTNAAWIQPSGVFNVIQNAGVGYAVGEFQTSSSGTQYQLAVYNVNASTGAITMYFDDFFVGPQNTVGIIAKAPTFQTFTSGSGTYTLPSGPKPIAIRVRMVGGGGGGSASGISVSGGSNSGGAGGNTTFGTSLLVANGGGGGIFQGSGGSGGTASLGSGPTGSSFTGASGSTGGFVSGAASATTAAPGGPGGNTAFGGGGGGIGASIAGVTNTGGGGGGAATQRSGTTNDWAGSGGGAGGFVDALIVLPLNTYSYAVGAGGSAGPVATNGAAGSTGGSGYIEVTEIYAGSNVQMSADTDTRVVEFTASSTSPTVTGGGTTFTNSFTNLIIPSGGVIADSHSGYNASTGVYTVPIAGFYYVDFNAEIKVATPANGDFVAAQIVQAGSSSQSFAETNTITAAAGSNVTSHANPSGILKCNAGDTISVQVRSGSTSTRSVGTFDGSTITILRLAGPAVVAATETVAASYNGFTNTGAVSSSTGNTIVWSNKDVDTHNAMSSGVFTAPAAGVYEVTCSISTTSSSSGGELENSIQLNGSTVRRGVMPSAPTAAHEVTTFCHYMARLKAGDTIQVNARDGFGNSSYNASNNDNYIHIKRIGL